MADPQALEAGLKSVFVPERDMATLTTSPPQWNRDDSERRVQHPLERLKSSIRLYVSLEGAAVLLLYLALWFWIGLLLDYGCFKVFGLDWVQVLPWGFRAGVLVALLAGLVALVAMKVLFRLLREFSMGALALVLERRFPDQLGDRLITSVEMADPRLAERYGYSQVMIDETIRSAADRVDRLPVQEVFNWPRLRRYGLRVAAATVGLFLLVGVVSCLFARQGPGNFIVRFGNVTGIWFERNVLLTGTIWPRRAQLEVLGFPESGDLRVGRDAAAPTLRVRALKWVVADARAPQGWRSMHWSDLTADLLGKHFDPNLLPAEWRDLPLDDIELHVDRPENATSLDGGTRQAIHDVFSQLDARSASPRFERSFRKLEIPREVIVYYKGDTVRSEQSLQKQAGPEYSGVLSDLKESVRFTVRGEDYYTPYLQITVVPPPSLAELVRDEEQPAYLWRRPPVGGEPRDLKGKKVLFRDKPATLSGSASVIDVPAGTDLVLKARTDKPLQPGGVRLLPREASSPIRAPVDLGSDGQSFRVRFDKVASPLDFVIELKDTDNVIALRHVVIKPLEDLPPEVDVQVEVLRKVREYYLATARARIPFSGKVRDDHGLNDVDFEYTVASIRSQTAGEAGQVAGMFHFAPGMPRTLAPGYLAWLERVVRSAAEDKERPPQKMPVAGFVRRWQESAEEGADQLPGNSAAAMIREHSFDPMDEKEGTFDVEKLGLKEAEDQKGPSRYRLRLWVSASDSNVETGPGIGQSKDRFAILIVSENELLLEIAKEEESLHIKLEEAVNRLKDARNKLDQVVLEMPTLKPEEYSPMARRAEEFTETITKSWDLSREVSTDYQRILREYQVNRVDARIVDRVDKTIRQPLDDILNQDFDRTDKAMEALHKALEDKKNDQAAAGTAARELQGLIDRLTRVLDAMADITTINSLIKTLTEIEKRERDENRRLKELYEKKTNELLDSAFTPSSKPPEKKP
jgi:hypothetical protein